MREERKSLRIQEYDYSQSAAYFIIVCTQHRRNLFGRVINGEMCSNAYGTIVHSCWNELPVHYPEIELDTFVVMPNHVHGIIMKVDDKDEQFVGARHASPLLKKPHYLGNIVGSFKSAVTKHINEIRHTPAQPVWQRNYYEHIIRNERALNTIREYIDGNPEQWQHDKDNAHANGRDAFAKWLTGQGKTKIPGKGDPAREPAGKS